MKVIVLSLFRVCWAEVRKGNNGWAEWFDSDQKCINTLHKRIEKEKGDEDKSKKEENENEKEEREGRDCNSDSDTCIVLLFQDICFCYWPLLT